MSNYEGPERFWLYYLADVLSGRVQNSLDVLAAAIQGLRAELQTTKEKLEMSTENEQKILDVAQGIRDNTDRLGAAIEGLKQKIVTLQEQAASDQAHQPEDLSQEFQELNAALQGLGNVGKDAEAIPSESPANPAGGTDQPLTPPETGGPSGTPDPTPLAGTSGPTNPEPTLGTGLGGPEGEGDAPEAFDQPQPGSDTGTSGVPAGSVAGDDSENTADTSSPANPAETPVEGTDVPTSEGTEGGGSEWPA